MNRKSFLSVIVMVITIPFAFCSCREEEESEYVSEIGTWNLSDVEYYYDGKFLDYKDFEIDIWPTSRREERCGYVSHGGFILNGDGTGKAFGLGEFGTNEFELTYTKDGQIIHINIENKGIVVTAELKYENNRLRNSSVESDIYGWAPDGSEEVCGADGNGTHSLEIIQIYTKKQ
ncbi:MAG: hypothetical protein J6U22_09805 [Bacteroidaceae bacterium]|nr:hypothetical protein [Bacteroidaceae bacterium]